MTSTLRRPLRTRTIAGPGSAVDSPLGGPGRPSRRLQARLCRLSGAAPWRRRLARCGPVFAVAFLAAAFLAGCLLGAQSSSPAPSSPAPSSPARVLLDALADPAVFAGLPSWPELSRLSPRLRFAASTEARSAAIRSTTLPAVGSAWRCLDDLAPLDLGVDDLLQRLAVVVGVVVGIEVARPCSRRATRPSHAPADAGRRARRGTGTRPPAPRPARSSSPARSRRRAPAASRAARGCGSRP